MKKSEPYRIGLDGKWSLEEFHEMPHTFNQVYAFHYAFNPDTEVRDPDVFENAFASYPWQGGYSAVNFYRVLFGQVPARQQPKVNSIRFESPGWIELQLYLDVAKQVGETVAVWAGATLAMVKLYHSIHKEARDRELLRIKVEREQLRLTQDKLKFLKNSSAELATAMKFMGRETLDGLTKNPVATFKIIMSFARRVNILAEFEEAGKAHFPE